MKFKEAHYETQFHELPKRLQEIALYFESLCQAYGIEPTITRCWDAVAGDSGVHEAHRAIDFRDQYVDGSGKEAFTFTPEQAAAITADINARYPRNDGKLVCIHHSFHGMPFHFHLQTPIGWD